jgi:hypothetical protein
MFLLDLRRLFNAFCLVDYCSYESAALPRSSICDSDSTKHHFRAFVKALDLCKEALQEANSCLLSTSRATSSATIQKRYLHRRARDIYSLGCVCFDRQTDTTYLSIRCDHRNFRKARRSLFVPASPVSSLLRNGILPQ